MVRDDGDLKKLSREGGEKMRNSTDENAVKCF